MNSLNNLINDPYKFWLIDLDNTIYCESEEINQLITNSYLSYISYKCRCNFFEANEINQELYSKYGHSIIGAYKEKLILKSEIKNFFSFVHNLPIEEKATPNTKVIRLISSIKGRKFIFSNAYRPYIERILAKLELEGEFEDIWDIYRLKLHCKPNHTSFELFKSEYAINYSEMVLIDDSKTNLKSAQALGIHSYHPNVLTT